MRAKLVGAIETGAELIASAMMGGAAAFAAYAFLQPALSRAQLVLSAGGAAFGAFVLSSIVMRVMHPRKSSFRVPVFDVLELETALIVPRHDQPIGSELLLTEADRVDQVAGHNGADPLLLDDVLTQIGPDSRVVRLFDRKAMPTPGQLHSQIEGHLAKGRSSAQTDAARALSEALAELKRSLR